MKLHLLCLSILLVASIQLLARQNNCQHTDSLVLIALHNSITNLNWDLDLPINQWSGVYLNDDNCVTKLNLSNKNLSGTVAPEINNFTVIKQLDLSDNNLSGEVLKHLTNLGSSLDTLNLSNNQFTEELDSNLKFESEELRYLNISNNNFSGDFKAFFAYGYMHYVNIANNQFRGEFPFLRRTREIYAQNNLFEGEIPYRYSFYAEVLNVLNISGNQLSGEIPHQLSYAKNLTYLNLEDNLMSGCFHKRLRKFCDSSVLLDFRNNFDVSWNNFCNGEASCGIDPNCTVNDSLSLLALYNTMNCHIWDINQYIIDWQGVDVDNYNCVLRIVLSEDCNSDYIPAEIGNFSKLIELYLDELDFSGSIPPEIGKLTQLKTLWLVDNQLTGEIPAEIGNLNNLEELNLDFNRLSGHIPEEIGNLSQLKYLDLSFNLLSGPIPASIGNLKQLKKISIFRNRLSGPIPASIGNLSQLETLFIPENQLSGSIPIELLQLSNLNYLIASSNQLSGCFNSSLSGLCGIANFYNNKFEGSWYNFCRYGAPTCDEPSPCRSNDSLSLLAFYQSVNGLNWDMAQPITTWEGVNFDSQGCVNELILSSKNLSGEISDKLQLMKHLKKIDLSINQLNFSFSDFSKYESSNIEILDLSNNAISYRLTNFGNGIRHLKYLDLSNNSMPDLSFSQFDYLTKLEYLNLSNNNLDGLINIYESDFVYYLPKIYYFNISQNDYVGDFPISFFNLCNRLLPPYNGNAYFSEGNNFNISWEEFCRDGKSNYCKNDLTLYNRVDTIIYENIYEADYQISVYQKIASNTNVTLKANKYINLETGTIIDSSTDFNATIGACQK